MFYKKKKNRSGYYLMIKALLFMCFILVCSSGIAQSSTTDITINATKTTGSYKTIWSYYGYDEANYTTRKDGKKLLMESAALSPSPDYVRMHNLLTSGDDKVDLKWSTTQRIFAELIFLVITGGAIAKNIKAKKLNAVNGIINYKPALLKHAVTLLKLT